MPTDRSPTRVVLADDECLFRTSLRELLGVPPDVIRDVYGTDVGTGFELVGEASSGEETVRVVTAVRPDLLLLDLNMPRLSGLDAVREIARASLTTRTILLTGEISRAHVLRAVRLGVNGVVVKHAATELLFEAIAAVMAGGCWLDQTVVSDLIDHTRTLLEATAAGRQEPIRLTRREHEVLPRGRGLAEQGNREDVRAQRGNRQAPPDALARESRCVKSHRARGMCGGPRGKPGSRTDQ
jgi:DNA-binding NarL/FixJ family response regulator